MTDLKETRSYAITRRLWPEVAQMDDAESLSRRRARIREVDERGIIATPANSKSNELLVEAARLSILNDGRLVRISYDPEPGVALK